MDFHISFIFLVITAVCRDVAGGSEFREKRNVEYKCFDCELFLNRLGPECPLSSIDCYGCLPGFEEEPVNNGARRHKKACNKLSPVEAVNECTLDKDCAPGYFCFLQKVCSQCLDCRAYLRQQTVVCATKLEDCGSCLPGSIQKTVDSASTSKPCEQQRSMSAHQAREETESRIYTTGLIILGCTIVFAGGFMTYFVFSFMRHRAAANVAVDETPVEPPPPYTPQRRVSSEQCQVVCGSFKVKPEEQCTARVFRQPRYNVTPIVPEQAATRPISVETTVPYVVDEETVPCPWRPSNEGTSVGVNTFSGQFPRTRSRDESVEPPPKRHK